MKIYAVIESFGWIPELHLYTTQQAMTEHLIEWIRRHGAAVENYNHDLDEYIKTGEYRALVEWRNDGRSTFMYESDLPDTPYGFMTDGSKHEIRWEVHELADDE